MEEKVFNDFKKLLGDEVKDLDLFITGDYDTEENNVLEFIIMEHRDNGRVFDVTTNLKGKIINWYEVF